MAVLNSKRRKSREKSLPKRLTAKGRGRYAIEEKRAKRSVCRVRTEPREEKKSSTMRPASKNLTKSIGRSRNDEAVRASVGSVNEKNVCCRRGRKGGLGGENR